MWQEKIIEEAKKYGIDKKDIVIDVLAMTISLNRKVRRSRWKHSKKSGRFMVSVRFLVYRTFRSVFRTVRQLIQNFYTMAMQNGLSAGIINPSSEDMMRSYYSFCALMNYDKNCEEYIRVYGSQKQEHLHRQQGRTDFKEAIEKV